MATLNQAAAATPSSEPGMPLRARVYIALVIAGGAAGLVAALVGWRMGDPFTFALYFMAAVLASGMKVRFPGMTVTISACFLFVLIGIVSFSLPEALAAGCASVLVQCCWHSRQRPRLVPVLFNVASVALAIGASAALFYSPWLHHVPIEFSMQLALLGACYFVCNTLPVAGVVALTSATRIWPVWRASYLWTFPYYVVGAAAAGLFEIAKRHIGWQTATLVIPVAYLVYRSYTLHFGRVEVEKRAAEEAAALHLRTVESLAMAIEAKDQTTHDHLRRVQVYALQVGLQLGLSELELEALRAASLLHDIGKLAVPEYIINKPGKLTREEFQKMKVHPVVGAEILERVRFPYPVAPIVRSHHEKWDGSGYPAGLQGEQIPIGARIIAAVDFLDALASDRQYRKALPLPEAVAMLVRESGRSFDPRIVAILASRYEELEQLARNTPVEEWKLSTDINVERGAAPGAGFESSEGAAVPSPLEADPAVAAATLPEWAAALVGRVRFDALVVFVRQGRHLSPLFVDGVDHRQLSLLRIPVGEGLSGWVAENDRPIINGNPLVEPGYRPESGVLRSAVSVPVRRGDSSVGVLTLYHSTPNAFQTADLRQATAAAADLARLLAGNSTAQPEVLQAVAAGERPTPLRIQ